MTEILPTLKSKTGGELIIIDLPVFAPFTDKQTSTSRNIVCSRHKIHFIVFSVSLYKPIHMNSSSPTYMFLHRRMKANKKRMKEYKRRMRA